MPSASPAAFAAKWIGSSLKESAAAQEHFIDLCRLIGVPTPADADPDGDSYTFEKGVEKTGGGSGFADVWKRDHFAWEYKSKHKNLAAAYQQLLQYREALENPLCRPKIPSGLTPPWGCTTLSRSGPVCASQIRMRFGPPTAPR